MNRPLRALAPLLFLVLTGGCALSMVAAVAKHYMKVIDGQPVGEDAVGWVYVPGVALTKGNVIYDCGPETLTAVFHFWDRPLTIDEVAAETYRVKDKGTLSIDLALYSRRKGMAARMSRGNLEAIQQAILKGTPPIIMQTAHGSMVKTQNSSLNDLLQ